jgi:hypothetical protein
VGDILNVGKAICKSQEKSPQRKGFSIPHVHCWVGQRAEAAIFDVKSLSNHAKYLKRD